MAERKHFSCRAKRDRKQSRTEKSRPSMVQKGYPSGLGKCSDFIMYEVCGRDRRQFVPGGTKSCMVTINCFMESR